VSGEEEFNAEEFLRLPVKERVKLCRRLAGQAQSFADKASPKYRGYYVEIAKQWQTLADEMEQSLRVKE
jgi:hypothetical protein